MHAFADYQGIILNYSCQTSTDLTICIEGVKQLPSRVMCSLAGTEQRLP